MHFRKINNKDQKITEARIEKILCSWKSKFLSVCGRLVLLNSVVQFSYVYVLFLRGTSRVIQENRILWIKIFLGKSSAQEKNMDL